MCTEKPKETEDFFEKEKEETEETDKRY